MRNLKKILSGLLVLSLSFGLITGASAATNPLDAAIADTGKYMLETVANPQVGSIGGEWAVLGLARSGCNVPQSYYQRYYATVEAYVRACRGNLHDKKYTEYSRIIVALTAIGKDARKVAGYDLTRALGDYDKTIAQGLNGPIWALIALDSGAYPMPQNPAAKTQATREQYVQRILACQLADGGWSLFGGTAAASSGDGVSDPDITGMALQALSNYQADPKVKRATEKALTCMSLQQQQDGGFASWDTANSESGVQMLVALAALSIPLQDKRFVKNEKTVLDSLMTYYLPGKGFRHTAGGSGSNQMASEQGFYGMVAAQRLRDSKPALYRMTDSHKLPDTASPAVSGTGLTGKHADVTAATLRFPGATFADVQSHQNRTAIEALAARGIISGTDGVFAPNAAMTRAEFAAITVRALGLIPKTAVGFSDVPADAWYAPFVGTAHKYGIIAGDNGKFFPNSTLSRQEAAMMLTRAAKLCGMDTLRDAAAARDSLSPFTDYTQSAPWARSALAFCCDNHLLQAEQSLRPNAAVTRCEIAQALFLLLDASNLL